MKALRKHDRKVNSITNGRWTAYMAAAAASSFAAAHTAEAEIHYSGLINQHVAGRHDVTIPLDPTGGSFIAGHNNYVGGSSSFSAGGVAFLYFHGAQSAAVAGASGCFEEDDICASNLKRGDVISVRPFVQGVGVLAYDFYFNGWGTFGNFQNRGIGLAGFKFNNGAGDQYGWVRVKMLDGRRNMFTVIDYAYGDPGDRVFAGQKSKDSAPTMESLGGLALGAAGLCAWRRRRREVAG
jgi:MYXO-CTERM domain-containing protein